MKRTGIKTETNSRVYKLTRRNTELTDDGNCSRCPLHDKENKERRPKPDKYKNKRRKK